MTEKVMIELAKNGPAYIKAIAVLGIAITVARKISKSKSVDVSADGFGHIKIDEEENKQ